MTQRFSAQAWLIWTVAAAFIVLITRNPLYLSLILASVLAVYLSLEQRSAIALAWSTVLRIGLVVAGISVLFNVLTVHSGDRTIASLPSSWPIVGGALTWNAVLYGVISGMALLCLLLIAATLSTAVDRSALVRMMPQSLGTLGVAAAAALSMFPQMIAAIGQVREAHHSRGLRIRSVRDLQRLIIPVLNLGLERAFHLAESMESRGFGNRATGPQVPPYLAVTALGLATGGVVLIGIGYPFAGVVSIAIALVMIVAVSMKFRSKPIHRYRVSRLSRADLPVVLSSIIMIGITGFELAIGGGMLSYSTYPQLTIPDFSMTVAAASVMAAIPAVMSRSTRSIEPAHA